MKNKKFFCLSLIYFISMLLVAVVFVLGYTGIFRNDWLSSFLIQIVIMFGIPMLLYTLFVSKSYKKTFQDTGFRKISKSMVFTAILLGIVLYLLNTFVANAFSSLIHMFGYENLYKSVSITLDYQFLLKEFLLAAVLPGICEEFLHRGIMLHAGKKTTNPRFVLIISSILFGLVHLNINQFFYAAILGVLIGYVSIVSNSIYPAMIIHFSNNFLSMYFFYGYYLDWPLAKFVNNLRTDLYASNVIIYTILITIGVFLLIWAYKTLVKRMTMQRVKMDAEKVIRELEISDVPIEIAQDKINQATKVLNLIETSSTDEAKKGRKRSFFDQIFLISSIILGGLVTIVSFVWGVI